MAICSEEAKLELFLQWLKVNGAELRGCKIKYCSSSKGFGIFPSSDVSDVNQEILMVVPLNLAITPMRVLEDPLIGSECRSMFEDGVVDDRLLMMLFLTVERLRQNSAWKPYLDMLPTVFGNPLWFSDDELLELRGTTLHHATGQQKKNLRILFDEKVKVLAERILSLDANPIREVTFEDFLWANSIFWTRALTIPLPRSYMFQRDQEENNGENRKDIQIQAESNAPEDIVWVEGLVPAIDFCNHELKAAATWEVDGTGSTSGIPFSMYLLSAGNIKPQEEEEITISYGNKGNEELLYLYGFVVPDNPDDYLMIHYPMDAISDDPLSEAKMQLLEAQRSELRCLLPKTLLKSGFFGGSDLPGETTSNITSIRGSNFSWSGERNTPSYANKLVFPEEFLSSLRTVTMKESEIYQVSSLLEELVGTAEGERQPSEIEVRTATWEVCGDSSALQLLVDLLTKKMSELEEGSGTEEKDFELLNKAHDEQNGDHQERSMSRNKWASVVYRRGQKQLTRLFLREAEHALALSLSEGN